MWQVTYEDKNKGVINFGDAPNVLLYMGNNHVEDEDWEKIVEAAKDKPGKNGEPVRKGNGTIARLLKTGALKATKLKDGEADSLSGVSPSDAIDTVTNTYRIEMLNAWLATEKRKDVVAALKKQIAGCTAKGSSEGPDPGTL